LKHSAERVKHAAGVLKRKLKDKCLNQPR